MVTWTRHPLIRGRRRHGLHKSWCGGTSQWGKRRKREEIEERKVSSTTIPAIRIDTMHCNAVQKPSAHHHHMIMTICRVAGSCMNRMIRVMVMSMITCNGTLHHSMSTSTSTSTRVKCCGNHLHLQKARSKQHISNHSSAATATAAAAASASNTAKQLSTSTGTERERAGQGSRGERARDRGTASTERESAPPTTLRRPLGARHCCRNRDETAQECLVNELPRQEGGRAHRGAGGATSAARGSPCSGTLGVSSTKRCIDHPQQTGGG